LTTFLTTNLDGVENAIHRLGRLSARSFEHVPVAVEHHAPIDVAVPSRD
jgi:hypothetical protein